MLQAAEYDAVVSITKAAPLYGSAVPAPDGARPDAAADQAAHDVLVPDGGIDVTGCPRRGTGT